MKWQIIRPGIKSVPQLATRIVSLGDMLKEFLIYKCYNNHAERKVRA